MIRVRNYLRGARKISKKVFDKWFKVYVPYLESGKYDENTEQEIE